MAVFSKDLGIDLGTIFTRLADSTQVLMQEPTIVAIAVEEQKMVAVGQEARLSIATAPLSLLAVALAARPPSARHLRRVGWALIAASAAATVILAILLR